MSIVELFIYLLLVIQVALFYNGINKVLKISAVFVLFNILIVFASDAAASLFNNNLVVLSLYSVINPMIIFLIYFQVNKRENSFELIVLLVLYFWIAINTFFIQKDQALPTYNQQATSLFVIFLSLKCYLQILNTPSETPLIRNSIFWLNSGFFFYHASTFFLWVVFDFLLKKGDDMDFLLDWNYYVSLILYIVIGVAIFIDYWNNRYVRSTS
jgi:hypothetical protein